MTINFSVISTKGKRNKLFCLVDAIKLGAKDISIFILNKICITMKKSRIMLMIVGTKNEEHKRNYRYICVYIVIVE